MSKLYGERDIEALDDAGDYYMRHVMAMTGEGLHSKGDIAAELGHRDMQIDALERQAKAAHAAGHALGLPGGTDITVELVPAIHDLLAVQQDADRLVRELDVLLNGEAGAAKQASLCDLVAQVAKDGVVAKTRFDGLLEAMHGIAGTLDELSQEDAVSSLKGGAAGIASGIRKSIIKIMGAAPAAKDNV